MPEIGVALQFTLQQIVQCPYASQAQLATYDDTTRSTVGGRAQKLERMGLVACRTVGTATIPSSKVYWAQPRASRSSKRWMTTRPTPPPFTVAI